MNGQAMKVRARLGSIREMGHSHSHSHDHEIDGGWQQWLEHSTLRIVLLGVLLAAVATVAGVVAMWPSDQGRQDAVDSADEIGLVSDRLSATIQVVNDGECSYSEPDNPQRCRVVELIVHEGPDAGSVVALPEIDLRFDLSIPDLAVGDRVILGYEESTNFYFFADKERRATLVWLTVLFVGVVLILGRVRGVLALLAMALTLVVLVGFLAPSVLDGNDPLVVAVISASAIAFVSLYLTHGFSPTTTVALAGTLAALALTLGLSWVFFELASFTGLATEEALILPFISENLNVSSLLLGGAVIGALGALDDVTVTQVATVAELKRRRPDLGVTELVTSGIRVGREHIASTVNTLLLAYVGASMPLLLLFTASEQSLQMAANSELIAIEIVMTLCGSIGLVAAMPITTVLAAIVVTSATPAALEVESDGPPHPPQVPPTEVEERTNEALTELDAQEPPPTPAPSWDDFTPLDDFETD